MHTLNLLEVHGSVFMMKPLTPLLRHPVPFAGHHYFANSQSQLGLTSEFILPENRDTMNRIAPAMFLLEPGAV
jgi:hypothetical protein